RPVPSPFLVLATQNPIEQEGTYPLPEAQLDRFLLKIRVEYPTRDEERSILAATTGLDVTVVSPVLGVEGVLALRRATRVIPASEATLYYAVRLARATWPAAPDAEPEGTRWLRWGAGPRAGQALVLAGKAWPLLKGRMHVAPADVREVALPVFRHRLLPTFRAEAEGKDPDTLIRSL